MIPKKSEFPPFLYWLPPQVSFQPTAEVTGTMDLNALLQGREKFWIKTNDSDPVPQQKVLVFADWSWGGRYGMPFADRRNSVISQWIDRLLRAGFSIKILRKGKVETLHTADDISFQDIDPLPPSEINRQLAEQGISAEQSYLLDYVGLRNLLSASSNLDQGKAAEVAFLDLKDLLCGPEIAEPRFAALAETCFDEIRLLSRVDDPDGARSMALLSRVKYGPETKITAGGEFVAHQLAIDRDNKIIKQVTRLEMAIVNHSYDWGSLLRHTANSLEEINFQVCITWPVDFALDTVNLSHLRKIDLYVAGFGGVDINVNAIVKLIKAAPTLEVLLFNGCSDVNYLLTELIQDSPIKLKILSLTSPSRPIDSEKLQTLLEKLPELEELNLSWSHLTDRHWMLEEKSLKKMRKLTLRHEALSFESLSTLLKASPSLEELRISDDCLASETLSLEEKSLTQLRMLDLFGNKITAENLHALLTAAPFLEELKLMYCGIEGSLPKFGLMNLAGLRRLRFYDKKITGENLAVLLTAMPVLEELKLRNCKIKGSLPKFGVTSFARLRKLDLRDNKITGENLAVLLTAMPALEELKLDRPGVEGSLPKFGLMNFARLRKLDLSGNKSTGENLAVLLTAMPALEELELGRCEIEGSLPKLGITNFARLRKLNLNRSTITEESLYALLAVSPALEKLILSSFCSVSKLSLRGKLVLEPGALSALREMDLAGARINIHSLRVLVDASPNLENLDVSNCDALIGYIAPIRQEFFDLLASASRLRVVSFTDPTVSGEYIERFQKRFPAIQFINKGGSNAVTSSARPLATGQGGVASAEMDRNRVSFFDASSAFPGISSSMGGVGQGDAVVGAPSVLSGRASSMGGVGQREAVVDAASSTVPAPKNEQPPKPSLTPTSEKIDTQTTKSDKSLSAEEIFYELSEKQARPVVNGYRLGVHRVDELNLQTVLVEGAAALYKPYSPPTDIRLKEVPVVTSRNRAQEASAESASKHYRGHLAEVRVTADWQPLPSLSAREQMNCLSIQAKHQANIEIGYSETTNLYYIRTKNGQSINTRLKFEISVPQESVAAAAFSTHADLNALIKRYQAFGSGELTCSPTDVQTLLEAIDATNVGACRHRVAAFLLAVQCLPGYKSGQFSVRAVTNKVHTFLELREAQGPWQVVDLGGFGATPTIQPLPDAVSIKNKFKGDFLQPAVSKEPSLAAFQDTVFSDAYHSQLIDCDTKEICQALSDTLHAEAAKRNKPVFYVNRIEQLSFLNPRLCLDNKNRGLKVEGLGGTLYDFFFAQSEKERFLVLDLSGFTAKERVTINTLFDSPPTLDGVRLPDGTRIIGMDNLAEKQAYRGVDFLSRFKVHRQFNATLVTHLLQAYEAARAPRHDEATDKIVVELFNDPLSWRRYLEGEWQVGEHLCFKPNQDLHQALTAEKASTVLLRNPPWGDPEFEVFWQRLSIDRKMDLYGRTIALSNQVQLQVAEGYDWAVPLACIKEVREEDVIVPSESLEVINQSNFSIFFRQYHADSQEAGLQAQPGIFETYQNKPLTLCVSQTLSPGQWSRLLTEIQKWHIPLTLNLKGTGRTLPVDLKKALQPAIPAQMKRAVETTATRFLTVIHTQQVEEAMSALPKTKSKTNVMSLTNSLLVSEVLPHLQVNLADSSSAQIQLQAHFIETEIWKKLRAGERVVLKGPMTSALAQALLPLSTGFIWLNGEKIKLDTLKGQLIIISDSPCVSELFPHVQQTANGTTTLRHTTPEALLRLPETIPTEFSASGYQDAKKQTDAFNRARKTKVDEVLKKSPWVVLVGPTGVGKTAFIKAQYPDAYWGKDKLKLWLENKKGGILFLDEANLETQMDWLFLHDLRQKPPVVWFEGVQHGLTAQHKVIFACNPLSYGGERTLPALFQHAILKEELVVFEDLPLASLYQENIRPALATLASFTENEKQKITTCFMTVYQRLLHTQPEAREYFTARQLQVMAILFVNRYRLLSAQMAEVDKEALANYCAQQVARSALPAAFWEKFKKEMPYDEEKASAAFHLEARQVRPRPVALASPAFVFTPEHQAAWDLLRPLLVAHEQATSATPLPGLVYEGPSGIGKSHFIMWSLEQAGYQKAHLDQANPKGVKLYYHLPISAPYELKVKIILQAFHEGAVLLIDECNAQIVMEKLFNAVLSGQDLEGKPAIKPGFLFIGTQNPISLAGRQAFSNALANRCLKAQGYDYEKASLIRILEVNFPALVQEERDEIVAGFLKAQKHQHKHQQTLSTLRHLLEFARKRVGGELCLISPAVESVVESKAVEWVVESEKKDTDFPQIDLAPLRSALGQIEVKKENEFVAAVETRIKQYCALEHAEDKDFIQFKRDILNLKKDKKYQSLFESKTRRDKVREVLRKIAIAIKTFFTHNPRKGLRHTYKENKRQDKAYGGVTFFRKKETHAALEAVVQKTRDNKPNKW
ncbi:MAG: hypothetical protein HY939_02435 [Gammaproteobacteria bacterium]|nr:hypothetical protein [Gammaproteobacteria bacterium]